MNISIPMPPHKVSRVQETMFVPAPELTVWVEDTFIRESGKLFNPDHQHLHAAEFEFLWTNADYKTKGRTVLGTAEIPKAGNKWSAQRSLFQLVQWFGNVPDFLITIHAKYFESAGNPERCALIEHELFHCGQREDAFGVPMFSKLTGQPIWGMRGHDVEEFTGVVRRYGAQAAGVSEFVRAANKGPEIAPAIIDGICGQCAKRIA